MDTAYRYTICKMTKQVKTKEVCDAIREWIHKVKPITESVTEQRRQFISVKFKEFCEENSIKHKKTTPYNPSCNGMVERQNKTIREILRIMGGRKISELKEALDIRLNKTLHSITKNLPENDIKSTRILETPDTPIKPDKEKTKGKTKENSAIYKYNFPQDKLDSPWSGPFKVIRVCESGNWVEIYNRGKTERLSTKNVRRGNDVMRIDHKEKLRSVLNFS